MSGENLSILVETLKSLDCETEMSDGVLGRIFDTCVKLHDIIENSNLPSNGEEYQNAVKICIKNLEKCTCMVNELDLFSSNEAIEEVQTSSIRYLMLPALLGNLNLSQQSKELSERLKFIEIAEVYFKDFLLRCKNYELSKKQLINQWENEQLEEDCNDSGVIKKQSIADLAALRESKIQQYVLRKELKSRENELKPALLKQDSDEYVREYYLVIIERWILTAIEELQNIKSEKSVLQGMFKKQEDGSFILPKISNVKPLRPIIITKNEIQKTVFGLGYPSVPVMTIDDFYHQRFEKMIKEHKNSSEKSLQERAMTGVKTGALSKEEEEEIEKERLIEIDDADALQKARAWDGWKDENPRGSGNRKNKG